MHIVSAFVMLGGDQNNIVHRSKHKPVSWPEVAVLQALHGEESVYNIEYVRSEETTRQAEKARLAAIYGPVIVETLYPGRTPFMEMEMPGVEPAPAKARTPRRSAQAIRDEAEAAADPQAGTGV